jgi:hypothetical protein
MEGDDSALPQTAGQEMQPGPDSAYWCARSLDELEITMALLNDCIDGDVKELERQKSIIDMCKQQVEEIKNRSEAEE